MMKKRITKLFGVGLVIAVLVSLLIAAVPVSASTLDWSAESIPDPGGKILLSGSTITDIAVSGDGEILWACVGTTTIYKSSNGGISWTDVSTGAGGVTAIEADLIAIAPDNSNIVAVAATDVPKVNVTTNGGASFGNLGTPSDSAGDDATEVYDLDVSAEDQGVHYVAVTGTEHDTNGGPGNVWVFNIGDAAPAWDELNTKAGYNTPATTVGTYGVSDNTLAVQFSPAFSSDKVMCVVMISDNISSTQTTLEMYSVSLEEWNSKAGFDGYPVSIKKDDSTAIDDATAASLSLAPTYLGSDDAERVAFVGITATTDAVAGVYRLKDTTDEDIKTGVDIHSVAYDGTNLVAGPTGSVMVWRSADPMASNPTFIPTTDTKRPGGDDQVTVAWAGTKVVAGTQGDESCFSVSEDNGATFNDLSLIDTALTHMTDIAVAGDGSYTYMATDDNTNLSIWRIAEGDSTWKRVLSRQDTKDYIIRIAPENPAVVYVARPGTQTVFYTTTAGEDKWFTRTARYNLADLAVESDEVAYGAVNGSPNVIKTTNGGFTWGNQKDTDLKDGNIYTISSLGEDQLIVGSDEGYVSYSADGNSNWSMLSRQIETGGGSAFVTALGLNTGDYIIATTNSTNQPVYRWEIGWPSTKSWKSLANDDMPPSPLTDYYCIGMGQIGGGIYAAYTDGTNSKVHRTYAPGIPEPNQKYWSSMAATGYAFIDGASTNSMKLSSGSVKAWATDGTNLYSYDDTLAGMAVDLMGPADGYKVPVNTVTGKSYSVTFTWARPSEATNYQIFIAFDEGFDETAYEDTGGTGGIYDSATTDDPLSLTIGPDEPSPRTLVLMPGTTYYWRVNSLSPVQSGFSETRSFVVEPGVAMVPSVLSPANGADDIGVNPAFSWSPVSGATKYEWAMAAAPHAASFGTPIASATLAETGIRPSVKLEEGRTYFWRVRAVTPVMGDWSTIANFTVMTTPAPAAPPVVIEQVSPPQIVLPAPQAVPDIVIPPAPEPPAPIAPGYIWAVIIIGAVLVIAVIVLIVRTRRAV